MKKLQKTVSALLAALALIVLLPMRAAADDLIGRISQRTLDNIYQTTGDYLENMAGQYTPQVGSVGGEWLVVGLERSGRLSPDGYYDNVLAHVLANINDKEQLDSSKSTENSRVILALTAAGYDVTNVGGHNLLRGLTDLKYVSMQGNNGAIWALIAFDSQAYAIPGGDVTRDALVAKILEGRANDGGWGLFPGMPKSDVDVTSMAIQALAPYYKKNAQVKTAVDAALDFLSGMQEENGDFASYYSTICSESTSQVIVALTALGIDPTADARFIKNGNNPIDGLCAYYVPGGGFKHLSTDTTANGMATEQGYYALAAYFRFQNGQKRLYDMTDVGPRIMSQPADVCQAIGTTAKFTVRADGTGLKYQWQYRTSSGGWTNTTLTGAKTATLSVPVTAARNGAVYRCVVKKANGAATNSQPATLLVKTKITTQPKDVTQAIGTTAKFTVKATGVSLTYQWQYKTASGNWTDTTLTGAKTATLSVPVTAARNGLAFRCVITDGNGAVTNSNAATLKVATKITTQPKSVTQAIGTTATFTVKATGVGLTYQWQYKKGSGSWTNTTHAGAKTDTLSVPVTAARNGLSFRCVITDGNGAVTNSNAAVLKVKTNITTQPASVTAAEGTTAKFTVKATGVSLKYQWQHKAPGGEWTDTTLTGAKTATLSVAVTAERNGWLFRCVITDGNSAVTSSNAATLKVATKITTQPKDVTQVIGTTATFTVKATGVGLTYQWQYKKGSGSWTNTTLTGAKTDTLSVPVTAARNGLSFRCVITDGNGAVTNSNAAILKVKTNITTQPKDVTQAIGTTAKFTVKATGVSLKYQWQYKTTSGEWTDATLTGAKTATLSVPVTAERNGWLFRCVITDGNGAVTTSNAAKLTVK